ncbi:MAG: filamentous hemagglutinin N-terminal domain-containing protein, partial [Microcoleus sp.]
MKLKICKLWLSIVFCSFYPIAPSNAEIVPDATLPVNTTVIVNDNNNFIHGGTQAGNNLFHSFREFSLLTGETAFFNNSTDVKNIFTRVTGGSISNIDGGIKANGTANLFLLNPNGIVFGPNASLNIGGSFLATTASAVQFGNGTEFGVNVSQNTPLLIVNVPLGLQYGQSPRTIVNRSTAGLQVRSGNSLILAGGDVRLEGGVLLAPGGRVELAAVAVGETVGLNASGNNVSLVFPAQIARADVSLTNGADVNVRAGGGGNIAVNAHNLNLSEGSKLRAGIAEKSGAPDALAGDINVNATGAISFDGIGNSDVPSGAYNLVTVETVGEGGDINITAETLSLTNGAQVKASTLGEGNAGNVNIRIRNVSSFEGADTNGNLSGVYSRAEANEAVGNGGNINISTGSLFVTNGAVITASTQGRGNAGNVEIYVRNDTVLDGLGPLQEIIYASGERLQFQQSSGLFSSVKRTGVGEGGNILLTTGSLSIANGGVIVTRTEGQGRAGNITVNATDFVTVNGVGSDNSSSALLAPTEPGAGGRGGDITINTNFFRVSDGAVVNSQTQNEYLGGNITINSNIFEATGGG